MNKEQKRQAELIKEMLETFKSEGYTDIIITASKFGGGSHSDVVLANQGTVLGLAELLVGINSSRSSPPKVIFEPMLDMFKPNPNWHSRSPMLI